jgi:ribonuclease D
VLVDPLAKGLDMKPFFELMANSSVLKVFHAARQDIEIIYNRGGLIPHPIFDTQVAAMVCGFGDSVSYDQLVSRTKGVQIDKSSRFTDWSRRPLSEKQLDYALADVTHLRDVYLYLKAELEREGRSLWLSEEMDVLEAKETYDIHPDDAWQRLKMRLRKPQELAVLKYVAAWREREARSRNVPRSRVIKDDAIYEIAQQQPKDAEALGRLRTIPKGWERSSAGAAVVEAVNTALALPKAEMPHAPRQTQAPEGAAAAAELLKVLLKLISEKHGVAPKVIANSEDLDKIAAEGENADVGALRGWRRELFGDPALQLIKGDVALRFVGKKVETVAL